MLASKKVTLGFDGFIDSIVKVIKSKDEAGVTYFESSQDFANYILDKQNKSFAFELDEQVSKLGGNMPIMANALMNLGIPVSCLGTLGFPKLHSVFSTLSARCELFSFAEPGISTAMEFQNNKVMMAEMKDIPKVTWRTVVEAIGIPQLISLFSDRDLHGVLNWSEVEHSSDLWRGLLTDVLPRVRAVGRLPYGYFDFSDCSRRSHRRIVEALSYLNEFAAHWRVVLGLNHNEAEIIYHALGGSPVNGPDKVRLIGDWIFSKCSLTHLVIHHATDACCWSAGTFSRVGNSVIEKPVILTGAGDNFNSGFCLGLLLNLDPWWCLRLAHLSSRYYLLHGQSISVHALCQWTAGEGFAGQTADHGLVPALSGREGDRV